MKRLFFSILGVCMVFVTYSQNTFTVDNIKYKCISSKEVEVCDLRLRTGAVLIIPEEITIDACNYKVTSIGERAFIGRDFESIKLPNSIKAIKEAAFWGSSIVDMDIPNSVTSIGDRAFGYCENLKSINIPNSVESIGSYVFSSCNNLEKLNIPNSVRTIGACLYHCEHLEYLVWPEHLIMPERFIENCPSLRSIKSSNGLPLEWLRSDMFDSFPSLYSDSPLYKELYYIENYRYSNWAYDRIVDAIKEWQKKGEFETTEQWKQRVTEENRKLELANVDSRLRNEFIKKNQPTRFYTSIDKYDADNNVFTIKVEGLKPFYLEVPLNEAEEVKKKWHKAKLKPSYGIVENEVGVINCICKIGKKTYRSVQYNPDNYIEEFALNLPPLEIDFGNDSAGGQNKNMPINPVTIDNTIDKEIPVNPIRNQKTFALIIGNENYQNTAKVTYAHNDANSFAAYCHKTLGIPEKNIRSYKDATLGVMMTALKDIKSIARAYKGDIQVIFYYAGHGIPGSRGEKAYLLPVDMDGSQPELCLSTEYLYKELSSLNVRSTIVFMDACFSGSQRGEGMLASARAVALKVKQVIPQGNCVVFSAASNEQTAFPYMEKGHGMFTYFLLKKLQDSKGNVTLGELGEYIYENVVRQSVVVNRKKQTPTIVSSTLFEDKWKSIKLK